MPHIHTKDDQHDWTVTAYILRLDGPEPKALLHMHRKHHILLPVGGHVELSETPWQAIAHELTEESGYQLTQLDILQPPSRIKQMSHVVQHPYPLSMNTHDIPHRHFHTDIEYGFVTEDDPAEKLSEGESSDVRWLSREELLDLPKDMIYTNTREVYMFMLDEALHKWDQVPTGHYLLDFPESYRTK